MAGTETANVLNVVVPAAGQEAVYHVVPGETLEFNFPQDAAVFSQKGNDLVIEIEGQGAVILQDYMTVAGSDNPPIIIEANGAEVPGNIFLASIQDSLDPAAGAQGESGGVGEYHDDPSSLFDPLNHLGGQADPGRPSPEPFVDPVRGVEPTDDTVNPTPVLEQIVLNPSFEHGYLNPAQSLGVTQTSSNWGTSTDNTQVWQENSSGVGNPRLAGAGYSQDGTENVGLGDGNSHTLFAMQQDISTHAGETITLSFQFLPQPRDDTYSLNNALANQFDVTLGGTVVGSMIYNTATLEYEFWVTGESSPLATVAYAHTVVDLFGTSIILNEGVQWQEITFEVTADSDHATLSFSSADLALASDHYGALIDNVTAYQQFDTEIFDTNDGHNINGTSGDDFIMGADRDHIDGSDLATSTAGGDTIHAGAGNDAVYGGNGVDHLYGDAGNDFLHGGGGDDHLYGGDGNDYLHGGSGADVMDGGAGNDIFVATSGDTITTGDGNDTVKLDFSSLEAAANDANIHVTDFTAGGDGLDLQDGLHVQSVTYNAGDGHAEVLVTNDTGTLDVVVHLDHTYMADIQGAVSDPGSTVDDVLQYVIDNATP